MNLAIRPDFRPLRRMTNLAQSTLVVAAVACNPYETGTAMLPTKILGCVQSETPSEEMTNPKHTLSVYFNDLERVVPIEAVGDYAKKIDADFNPGDSVKLIIMLGAQYNRRDPVGRATAENELKIRLDRLLRNSRIALDESATELRLEKSAIEVCSRTPK